MIQVLNALSSRSLSGRLAAATCSAICLLLGPGLASAAPERNAPDIVIADFEGTTYPAGWITTGTAFGTGPAQGTLPNQNPVSGFTGKGLATSYFGTDRSVGTLTSPPFVIRRRSLSFLIGGGRNAAQERIDLLVNGVSVRFATGSSSEILSERHWDVADLTGKTAILRITDSGTGSWGHISVDDIRLTDARLPDEQTRALQAATVALRAAVPRAAADTRRPVYHFHAPAQWMNDPNGPIYYRGWYHVFYQFNPYGDKWASMHWGHARSRDLVNWQQMPVALWPSRNEGEDHVFSGSIFPRGDGTPMAFYTSIGAGRDPEQWGAVSKSPDLATWTKSPANPLLTNAIHGKDPISEWRDPFLFAQDHTTYMLAGGGLHGRGVVNLYEATNPDLTTWKYLGVLFTHPDANIHNIECPNLAHIDGKWLLLTSTYGKVESFVGQLDLRGRRFVTEKRGVLADGSYASQLLRDADGGIIHLAWMNTDRGAGWNGYLTLPSVLHIAPDGTVFRQPAAKFESLRGEHFRLGNQETAGSLDLTDHIHGKSLELIADIAPGKASSVTFNLRASMDGSRSLAIRYDVATRTLHVPGRAPAVLPASKDTDLKLHVFLDNGALDVYAADGAVTLASFLPDLPPTDTGVRITVTGDGPATIKSLDIYAMKPARFDNAF